MGENLVQLLDRSGDDTKVVFWAHNGHIDREWDDGEPSAGGVLGYSVRPCLHAVAARLRAGVLLGAVP